MTRSIHGRRTAAVAALGAAAVVAALATTTPAAAAPVTGEIHLAAGASAIPGSYLVTLKETAGALGTQAVTQSASSLATRYGGAVRYTYTSALHGFAATMSEAAARKLAADPAVAYVEQDSVVQADVTQTGATWGIDRVDQRNLPLSGTYTYNTTASNVTAFVIDTGIQTSHSQFAGRASVGFDALGGNGQDCNGHGTHVSGTIGGSTYGLAKGVRLVAVRVLSCSGSGSTAGVIAGIDFVTRSTARPAVANMSLGGGASTSLDNAVTRSINAGVTYAIAAGNSNANACNFSPARTPAAITVGATTRTDARSSFSNFGTCLDIFAPGSSITSAWWSQTSTGATNTISGTSMATPHVAGGAALFLANNPTATPAAVRTALVNNATSGVVTNPGTGSPNRLLFVS